MSAVQIAGCSGAGKSTIAAELARRGLVSIDADDDPLLARFVDLAGAVAAEVPAAPDLAWLARHGWAWDPARLDELIRAAEPAAMYVCGGADNQQEVAGRARTLPGPLRARPAKPGGQPGASPGLSARGSDPLAVLGDGLQDRECQVNARFRSVWQVMGSNHPSVTSSASAAAPLP